jgi:Xaa-Pro aminopeptidase
LIGLTGGIWFLQSFLNSTDTIDFNPLEGYCSHILPIQPEEYATRHKKLAETLKKEGADALIMEGGATMVYYANIHWELTERAFMVILEVDENEPTGIHTTIVTPAFEASRAVESLKKARLPTEIQPEIREWLEHKSPFDTVKSVFEEKKVKRLIVEQDARLFIYQGVHDALQDTQVVMAPESIQMLRMVKSKSELDIMRCANTVTELAIRTVRPHITVGMTEFDIQKLMTNALHKAGLTNTWVLALVDENAALPHGSSSEKKVTDHSTVLIDTGGELLGNNIDISIKTKI